MDLRIIGKHTVFWKTDKRLFQVIPDLGAQRVKSPNVVRLVSEKFLTLLRPVILLCRKEASFEIVRLQGTVEEIFLKLHTETPWKKIYTRRTKNWNQRQKKSWSKSNSHKGLLQNGCLAIV